MMEIALSDGKNSSFSIAHCLARVKSADQILVVDKGTIAQQESHQALLAQDDIYRRFITIRQNTKGWQI